MRLIDTENFSKVMKDYFTDMITHHKYNVDCVDCNADLQHLLDEQPTAYDVDEIVKQLIDDLPNNEDYLRQTTINLAYVIEIVKQGVVSDDVCEWRIVDRPNNLPIYNTSCGKIRLQYATGVDIYCNGCGKKIKVVE